MNMATLHTITGSSRVSVSNILHLQSQRSALDVAQDQNSLIKPSVAGASQVLLSTKAASIPLCEVQVQGDVVRLPVELSGKQEQSFFIKQEASMDEDFCRTV